MKETWSKCQGFINVSGSKTVTFVFHSAIWGRHRKGPCHMIKVGGTQTSFRKHGGCRERCGLSRRFNSKILFIYIPIYHKPFTLRCQWYTQRLLQVLSRVVSAKNWLAKDVSEEILWRHVATVMLMTMFVIHNWTTEFPWIELCHSCWTLLRNYFFGLYFHRISSGGYPPLQLQT